MSKNVKRMLRDVKIFVFFFQEMKDTMKTPRDDGGTRKMANNTKEVLGDAK
jgi:hypothetical protein